MEKKIYKESLQNALNNAENGKDFYIRLYEKFGQNGEEMYEKHISKIKNEIEKL